MNHKYKPTIPEVLPFVNAYYRKPGNGVGGSLHLVLEDPNHEDSHVERCIENAAERQDWDGMIIGGMLRLMSRTQRRKLAAIHTY